MRAPYPFYPDYLFWQERPQQIAEKVKIGINMGVISMAFIDFVRKENGE